MTTPPAYHVFVGSDMAAKTCAATWATSHSPHTRPMTFPETNEGFSAFQQHLTQTGVAPAGTLIACVAALRQGALATAVATAAKV